MAMRSQLLTAKKRQRGSALVWVVSLSFIFLMAALVVESSRLYFAQRQLQSAANQLATALVEEAQTCGGLSESIDLGALAAARLLQLVETGEAPSGTAVKYAQLTLVTRESSSGISRFLISPVAYPEQSNAVSLSLSRNIGGLIGTLIVSDDVSLSAQATARKEVVAGLSIDSNLARLNTAESELLNLVFGQILGSSLDLQVNGLNELGDAVTQVDRLVADLDLSSTVNSIPVSDLLTEVLKNSGGLTTAAGQAVEQLAEAAINKNVNIEDVIAGVRDAQVPAGSQVNTLGLVQSIIFNVESSLPKNVIITLDELSAVPGLSGLLGLLVGLRLELDLTPAPGFVLAAARQDQYGDWPQVISRGLKLKLTSEVLDLGLIQGAVIDIDLTTAQAEAELHESYCASGAENRVDLRMASRTLLATLSAEIDALRIVGINLVSVALKPQEISGSITNIAFSDIDLGFYGEGTKQGVKFDGSDTALTDLTSALLENPKICALNSICVCSLLLGACNVVSDLLNDIVGPLLDSLIAPLLHGLGIQLVPGELVLESVGQQTTLLEQGVSP